MSQSPATSGSQSKEPARPKTSGLAIAGLIFGISGLCTFGLGALVGLILGILSLIQIKQSQGQRWRIRVGM
ncbi:MAG TPA: DUF4190 domain-containing protein [Phycisphaerae bacterium]|jgi:hypothetical protein|nr:DUF4190 domain-containing protein [Phycisphaerae bacterium]